MTERNYGIGIDLGTSNSAVSRVDVSSGRHEFAEARDTGGDREIPSLVYIDDDGSLTFGAVAAVRQNSPTEAHRVISNFKLLLRDNRPIETTSGLIEPETLVRGLLGYLKECYERTLHIPCTRAVITVPAHEGFDVDYRARVRDAAMGSDPLFESISTIPEPDAVLLSIADLTEFKGRNVLVFDMGGGTLDVSVRHVDEQDGRPFLHQLAVVGSDAAGSRVTGALADHALDLWQRKLGQTFTAEELNTARRISFGLVDDAKRKLSSLATQHGESSDKSYRVDVLLPGRGPEGMFAANVQVDVFTKLCRDVCDDAISTVDKALARAGIDVSDIDSYFAVGGSSGLPLMQSLLKERFGSAPAPLQGAFGVIDRTLAVARGAAIDDLDRMDSPSVPATLPVLERKLPYPISLLVDGRTNTKCLVPADSVLPFGPVTQQFFVPGDGDDRVSIELVRGEGAPERCVLIAPHDVYFPRKQRIGAPFEMSWFVDDNGELTVTAFAEDRTQLGVIRAPRLEA